jgi:hypothetical protein
VRAVAAIAAVILSPVCQAGTVSLTVDADAVVGRVDEKVYSHFLEHIYHSLNGVLTSCIGFVYSFGAALLDLDEPWKVIARGAPYILSPQAPYEIAGDVPNVAFPCAALTDEETGRIAIYYGCADTHTGLAFCRADELVAWVKENNGFPVPAVAPGVQR